MNTEQVPKPLIADADPALARGRLPWRVKRAKEAARQSAGALVTACSQEEFWSNTGDPAQSDGESQSNRRPVTARLGCGGSRRGPAARGPRGIDFVVLEDPHQVGIGGFQQFDEPVLDLDVVIGAGQAQPGGAFQRPATGCIEFADERLEIDCGHEIGLARL